MQAVEHSSSQTILRQHTANRFLNNTRGPALHFACWRRKTLTTGVARVANVFLVVHLFAGQSNLVCVDDDDVIAAIYVRSVGGLVLAADEFGHLRRHASQGLTFGIHHEPIFRDRRLIGG